MNDEPICELLEWDTEFFGCRIARVRQSHLSKEDIPRIGAWCGSNRIACLYLLADSSDPQTVRVAQQDDFHWVDIRVTLDRPTAVKFPPSEIPSRVRIAREKDIPALRTIARASHHDSRFYSDDRFPRSKCDALYETWIEKSCRGWAKAVLVAEDGGLPVGYISCHLHSPDSGKIGLVGVAAQAQGKELGKDLVNAALRWFQEQGAESVSVVTQGRNVRALRLYERCGFVTRSVELWFHKWFSSE